MLPVQPGVTQFVRENISTASYRKSLPYVDRLRVIIPYSIGICVPLVHFRIRQLSNRNPVAERKDNLIGDAQHLFSFSDHCRHRLPHLPPTPPTAEYLAYHNEAGRVLTILMLFINTLSESLSLSEPGHFDRCTSHNSSPVAEFVYDPPMEPTLAEEFIHAYPKSVAWLE
jgi:hypothetical protein